MAATVAGPQTASASAAALAPGFRFHPTDEELVSYYLKRKLAGRAIPVDAIAEVDLYKVEPWELPGLSRIRSRDLEWYFFSCLDRKYSNRSRTNRATREGYWKTTGKDRAVRHASRVVGMKKTLVFHAGRAPRGQRTNWVMHEYRLDDGSDAMQMQQDGYVVCRVFQKNGAGPQNGAQYGAPFVEEEWEVEGEEAADGMVVMPGVVEEDEIHTEEEIADAGNVATSALAEGDHVGGRKHLNVDNALQVNPSVQDIDSLEGDGCASLGGVHEELLSANEVQSFTNELGLNRHKFMEDTKSVIIDGSQSCPSRDDEYLEMNDLFSPVKLENSLWTSNNQYLVDEVDDNFLDDIFHVENIVGDLDQHSGQPELTQISQFPDTMQSNDLINSFDGSSSLKEEDLTFYDAPSHDLVFAQNTDRHIESHLVLGDPSSYETFDDLMSYFDASDYLQYHSIGYSDSSDYFDSNIWDHSNEEVNDPTMKIPSKALASSAVVNVPSSTLHATHWQYENDYGSFTIAPDLLRNDGAEKTVSKSLINMLGSITAPPAFAAEFPSVTGKSVGDVSASNPQSALRITAGIIEIHGLLLSYPEEIHKSVGFEPIAKDQSGVLTVLRGGFCLFVLSALTLAISCKVGLCIYGR